MTVSEIKSHIESGRLDDTFACLYSTAKAAAHRQRLCRAVSEFESSFGNTRKVRIFSAPGRTEIGGNHTDHQRGRVLAAAVDLDSLCVASPNSDNLIRVFSEGHRPNRVELDSLEPREKERNTSNSLIRGIARAMRERGYSVSGFDAYITSNVLKGSGLSSSAAFEVVVGTAVSGLFNGGSIPPVEIARIGQYAENMYFGKPSGLMDQTASAVGGCVAIDFADPERPLVEKVDFDFSKSGYTLCIVDTKGSHSDLTREYAAIPNEMSSVARLFGKTHLRGLNENDFLMRLPEVREKCGDRAALRALHFLSDNARVPEQVKALKNNDFDTFLRLISASGHSSLTCLQNIYSCSSPHKQGLSLALALSEKLLLPRGGAVRVHGGGFAGTVQAFVPAGAAVEYIRAMESVFGHGSCHMLNIRPLGAVDIMSTYPPE